MNDFFPFTEPFYYVPLCIDGWCGLYILVHTILYINGLCCVFFMGCYIYSPYHCDILIYYLLQCLNFLKIQFNALLRMCLFIHEISKQSLGCILFRFLHWWTFFYEVQNISMNNNNGQWSTKNNSNMVNDP